MSKIEIHMEECHRCKVWQDYLTMVYDPLDNAWYCQDDSPYINWDRYYDTYPRFFR